MNKIKITLVKSPISCPWPQKRTAIALGLSKMHRTVVHPDNAQIRGMVKAIEHLVNVQPAEE
jgi:large subunit ribosomal protein L30